MFTPEHIQRDVVTEFYGGRNKRPAFNAGAVAKTRLQKASATLLVCDFSFFSHQSIRIKDAAVSFGVKARRGSTSLDPIATEVALYGKHIMMWTTETVTRTFGGEAGIQGEAVVMGNACIHVKSSAEKITTHTAEVVGNNPADEWSNRFLAQWSTIVSLFRACILLTRVDNEGFYLYPTIGVTPDLKTQVKAPLWGFRRPDDPIKSVPTSTAGNKLEGNVISS
ncbi:hypothetical protein MGN70_007155 [Eutypa lata]|nr:hypothetical protein MGN70_007150 [Eutypa lata]KAI1252576.1 hypothetical protein MGN70_007155 [Eutypa lata]